MLIKGLVGYIPANALQALAGILTLILFTRLLGPEQYGLYAIGLTVMMMVQTLVLTWIEAALARFQAVSRSDDDTADHLVTLYTAWAIVGSTALVVTLFVTWLSPWTLPIKIIVAVAGLSAVARSLAQMLLERRRADGEVGSASAIDIILSVGGLAAAAVAILAGLGGVAPLLGMVAVSFAAVILFGPREATYLRAGRFSWRRLGRYAAYGLPVALSLILTLIISSTDRLMIGALLDDAAVGRYHAAFSMAGRILDVLFIWLGMAGTPAMVAALEGQGADEFQPVASSHAAAILFLGLPTAAGVALVAGPLAQLALGSEYVEAAGLLSPWIAASAFLAGLTTYYLHQAFLLAKEPRWLLAVMVVPAILNPVLNLVLIPSFGVQGAAASSFFAYLISAMISFGVGRMILPLPIPWRTAIRALVATIVMTAVVIWIPASGGLGELLSKAATGALTYLLCHMLLGLELPPTLERLLKR